ncbi:PepSY-like domain-containing protein [Marixanthomonas ophiurae]|uniref:Putative beta-lactamase-inhibitor-like PepSY-like domain-containing protein n=1 Tax=Marixanthomonas ophiurae TaxID=387659 RepID=A0A3E1QAD7_9FLAO|nr:PepSY-like domain-containing protein [Marixanthomonas ophiurae]RFN59064.1 hypothetical protein DZ858_03010 [Marixanthomonas ophiurae]
MKTLKFLLVALFVTTVATAQDLKQTDVPNSVLSNFQKENPNATDVEWEKEMDNYKVEFDQDSQEYEIWYSTSGTMVKMEQDITENMLPKAITSVISSKYSGYKVDDCEKITKDNKTTYKVELENGTDEMDVVFNETGKVESEMNDN